VCVRQLRPDGNQTQIKTMNAKQLKNAKIDMVTILQAKLRRFAAGLATPGVDTNEIQRIIDRLKGQIDDLEREIAILG
jgi:hypothetical protein